jgi:ABC-type branched-subunit amino acid transport system substrate-binding protein
MAFIRPLILIVLTTLAALPAAAQKLYDTGATDAEIKIGQTMPYSGPLSSYATLGKLNLAYFKMLNERGGVNGRKINLLSLDDGYSPPRTVEQVRRLVESDGVLLTFLTMGTPTNSAIHKYMNQKKVPMLFVGSGANKWDDPKNYPWTMGWPPSYRLEGKIFAQYIAQNIKEPKIGILYQNDDLGKDVLVGFLEGLGPEGARLIVSQQSYEVTDPTVDSQIIALKAAGASVFVNVTVSKFAAQAIRKAHDIGWQPEHLLLSVSASIAGTLVPIGLDKAKGIITAQYLKDVLDPAWRDDPGIHEYIAFMKRYYPEGDTNDFINAYAYAASQLMERVLVQAKDDLRRENVMKQAANLHDVRLPLLLPNILVNTSPTRYSPIGKLQLARFDGQRWVLFGGVLGD